MNTSISPSEGTDAATRTGDATHADGIDIERHLREWQQWVGRTERRDDQATHV